TTRLDILLSPDLLDEIKVIGDVAIDRKTPIAFSDIPAAKIREELGARDLPMILNNTPGVYATQSGGGDGDARVNIRGFNQRNVAVMVDGIPMNDMENGWVYWSNWFGLDNVTQRTQVQRGLGASKLAIPAIGGNINIMSQSMDDKFSLRLSSEIGNNNNLRQGFGINSGRLKGNWGVTAAFSYKTNEGWVDNLNSKQLFYFLKAQKKWDNHSITFSAMGSPQQHEQRLARNRMSFYDLNYALGQGFDTTGFGAQKVPVDQGLRFNAEWGYLSRNRYDAYAPTEILSGRTNYYHKPIFNFKHFWTPNENFAWSNVLYASLGNGGGVRPNTSISDENGNIDYQYMYDKNTKVITNFLGVTISPANPFYVSDTTQYASSFFLQSSVNNHQWYGLLSTFKAKVNQELELSGGLDFRYYSTDRYQIVYDLLGGDYALISKKSSSSESRYAQDQNNSAEYNDIQRTSVVRREGDKINYNITSYVVQSGLFLLAEYSGEKYTAFINATASNSRYNRVDHFALRDSAGNEIESGWNIFNGATAKAGFSYRINEQMSVFSNVGYLSRAPMLANAYYSTSLILYDGLKNEEIASAELGYNIKTKDFRLALNAYYTNWKNRPVTGTRTNGTENFYYNVPGMLALHKGIELDLEYNLSKKFSVEGVLSVGDWRWKSANTAYVTDENGNIVGDPIQFDARNVRVGDAAQFQTSCAVRYAPAKGFYIKPRITHFDNNFAEFNPDALTGGNGGRQSWKMPSYYMIDVSFGYTREMSNKYSLGIRGNLMNVTNKVFITDALNNEFGSTYNAQSAGVYYGMGFRWNLGLVLTLN
ncbi:MAG: TonB-dependent receptor, partial [Flavobacteriales bacterium]